MKPHARRHPLVADPGDRETIEALFEHLDAEGSEMSASLALYRLGELRDHADLVPRIIEYLEEDSRRDVQTAGMRALGMLGDKRGVPTLQAALAKHETVRSTAVTSLAAIAGPASVSALRAGLSGADPMLRAQIATALAKIGTPDAVRALGDALAGSGRLLRGAIPKALAEVGTDEAVAELRAALSHADERLREQIVSALGVIGSDAAVSVLSGMLDDPFARKKVLRALSAARTPLAMDVLRAELGQTNSSAERMELRWRMWRIKRKVARLTRTEDGEPHRQALP